MASNEYNEQNTEENLQSAYEQIILDRTKEAEQSEDQTKLHDTADSQLRQQIQDGQLAQIARDHEITAKMLKHLYVLNEFEIIFICDDSGSMNTSVDKNSQRTRWNELCERLKILLKITVIFDSNGVNIYFLNRKPLLKVKDPEQIEEAFRKHPSGFTPLVPVLEKIFQSTLAKRGRDKKLLVLIATDGEPTDKNNEPNVQELKDLMLNVRNAETTYVSFLLCTDETDSIDYLDKWDRTMKHVDVTDDYHSEKEKIRKHLGKNFPFTEGTYIVKALVGPIVDELGVLNEPIKT